MTDVVYYIRRNGLIKIGRTASLKQRMRTLRPDELLAIEPGCRHIETGRHHQFNAHRVREAEGVEWFAPEPDLLEHIARIARMYPAPKLEDLMPAPCVQRRPSVPAAPLPRAEVEALERATALQNDDLSRLSDEELAQGIRDAELVMDRAPTWTGHLVAGMRAQQLSWSQIVKLTGVPQSTLCHRARPFLQPPPAPCPT
jgi:hypothetical protein